MQSGRETRKEVLYMMFYHEIFLSIQGESSDAGHPCIFVRMYGCPIGCSYCDQPQEKSDRKRIGVDTMLSKIYALRCKNVCFTGGEPMIYAQELIPVFIELTDRGYTVSVETSGCVELEPYPVRRSFRYVMDIKCPSSEVSEKNIYRNLAYLQPHDEVKFVVADEKDYIFARNVLKRYNTSAQILFSPMFDTDGKAVIGQELVNWILRDKLFNARIQIQLHKILSVR